ncbi:MAG: LamG domain-containing protein [Gemmatimonadota bacterium]|nr:LamG domain-containing protein [Gemmatimonadota bacterium]
MLASYPLAADAADGSGKSGDVTMSAITFVDGAAYIGGTYGGFDPQSGGSILNVRMPPEFDFQQFTIAVDFKADELADRPVLIGGTGYRWLGFLLKADGGLGLKYNNANRAECPGASYAPGTWYRVRLTYDGHAARAYLNGKQVCSVETALDHGDDRSVSVTDYSSGRIFKGSIRNLRIYASAQGQ